MQLPRAGIEYLRIMTANVPDGTVVEVSFDEGTTWHASIGTTSERKILIAGPDADTPGAAHVLTEERSPVWMRFTDNPEVVIRTGNESVQLTDVSA